MSGAAETQSHKKNLGQSPFTRWLVGILPGLGVCIVISAAAIALAALEERLLGRAWVEALVLAILIGAAVRTFWSPGDLWRPGISFSARTVLEVAIALLGASLNVWAILGAGPFLLLGIVVIVVVALMFSYAICRALKLSQRIAILVAAGNSICGNSAIAAVAPVIGATGKDVASSIAFTAVLGVVVVLALPAMAGVLALDQAQFGVMAGLTVYAVPQVLAATAPIGPTAIQIGTLVKLTRVLMLGPLVVVLSVLGRGLRAESAADASSKQPASRITFGQVVPWFIIAFVVMAIVRAAGLIPSFALQPLSTVTTILTIVSMAALGLGVDVKTVWQAGPRVTAAVTASILFLATASYALVNLLQGVIGTIGSP